MYVWQFNGPYTAINKDVICNTVSHRCAPSAQHQPVGVGIRFVSGIFYIKNKVVVYVQRVAAILINTGPTRPVISRKPILAVCTCNKVVVYTVVVLANFYINSSAGRGNISIDILRYSVVGTIKI